MNSDSTVATVHYHTSWDEPPADFLAAISKQTPNEQGSWGDISGVADPEVADYHVAFNRPHPEVSADRLVLFSSEPPVSPLYEGWSTGDCAGSYPIEQYYKPQRWWVGKNYDKLRTLESPTKTAALSWITTDKGKNIGSLVHSARRAYRRLGFSERRRQSIPVLRRGGTDGHILRMDFLDDLLDSEPNLLDLYGRGDFSGSHYCGEVADKWDGLADYRYSLAIENYSGPNYFSEKLTDALLAWCMPIYWGCTNLSDYLPEDSFVRIDIEDEDAPARVRDIVESDIRERNLDAIAEARRLILEKYQLWPTVERAINDIE